MTGATATNTPAAASTTPASAPPPAPAAAGPAVKVTMDAKLGDILVDGKGMTLYLYTKDTADTSNCNGGCLQAWPALLAPGAATPVAGTGVTAKLGVIKRSDGTSQVTANGMPLYRYAQDTKAGATTGQGVGGVWYVLTPAGTAMGPTATATPAAPAAAAPAPAMGRGAYGY